MNPNPNRNFKTLTLALNPIPSACRHVLDAASLRVLLSIIILFFAICPPHCNLSPICFCQFQVTFPLYVMGLMAFVGWFLLVFFAGVGFSAVPIDCIRYGGRSLEYNAVSPTSPRQP